MADAVVVGETVGAGAPISIQRARSATPSWDRLPLGGILRSPSWRTALTSRLSPGLPDTRAGPLSPPLRRVARLSRSSPPRVFFLAAEWQEEQCSRRTGRTFFSKNSTPAW